MIKKCSCSNTYFQIAAVRYDPATGQSLDNFTVYLQPTSPIPLAASKVNGLYLFNDRLCKRSNDLMTPVETVPARIALQTFTEWVLQTSSSSDVDPNQVICLGYNNSSFDDHFLLNHCQKKLDPEVVGLSQLA